MNDISLCSVVVCHEDPVMRLGLTTALERSSLSHLVTACAPDHDGPPEQLRRARVVVTDYASGVRICDRARHEVVDPRRRTPQVMVVTSRSREHEIRSAIDAGVKGYLLSGFGIDEFVNGVTSVFEGSPYLCSAAANRMVDSLSREPLTPREAQVLRCVVDGYVNKQICDELDIALGTVKAHMKSIFSKLGVATRTQVVCRATERGMVYPRLADSRDESGRRQRPASAP